MIHVQSWFGGLYDRITIDDLLGDSYQLNETGPSNFTSQVSLYMHNNDQGYPANHDPRSYDRKQLAW